MGGASGTPAAAATFLADTTTNLANFSRSPNKLATIMSQKWLSLIGVSAMPLWTDYRRTGYPTFIHFSQDPVRLNDTPPVRLLYPQTEINTNNENVKLQGVTQPADVFSKKIFWQNR